MRSVCIVTVVSVLVGACGAEAERFDEAYDSSSFPEADSDALEEGLESKNSNEKVCRWANGGNVFKQATSIPCGTGNTALGQCGSQTLENAFGFFGNACNYLSGQAGRSFASVQNDLANAGQFVTLEKVNNDTSTDLFLGSRSNSEIDDVVKGDRLHLEEGESNLTGLTVWQRIGDPDHGQIFRRPGSQWCIDGSNGGANGNHVKLWQCDRNQNNQRFIRIHPDAGAESDFYWVKKNAQSYAIDGHKPNKPAGTAVHMWKTTMRNGENVNANQYWHERPRDADDFSW